MAKHTRRPVAFTYRRMPPKPRRWFFLSRRRWRRVDYRNVSRSWGRTFTQFSYRFVESMRDVEPLYRRRGVADG